MVGPEIVFGIGVATFGLAVTRELIAIRERRRSRPVVVLHEDAKRHFIEGGAQAASVHLTNESAASAFNIRFGVQVGGVMVPWKHAQTDKDASRLGVLPPSKREPPIGTRDVVIPDAVLWSMGKDVDPDVGRSYWALYQSPAGDWWTSFNPADRSGDLTITPVRSRKWGTWSRRNRRLTSSVREGQKNQKQAIRDLRDGAQ